MARTANEHAESMVGRLVFEIATLTAKVEALEAAAVKTDIPATGDLFLAKARERTPPRARAAKASRG